MYINYNKILYNYFCAMKFWHLIFAAFFVNYFSLDKMTECVNLLRNCEGKMRPSFDEIFGKGWDEKETKQQRMDKSAQQNNGQMGEGNDTDQMSDNDKIEEQNKNHKRKTRSDQEKRVIIEKFHLIKEKLKEIGQFQYRIRVKIEQQIGRQLGANRDKIYNWKKELGIRKNSKCFSGQEKRVIIEKFHLIKEKLKEIGQFPNRKREKIEQQIGGQLGVSRDKIYNWKREMGENKKNNKHYYEEKKCKFIERLDKFNKEMPRKGKQQKIAEELDISKRTFHRWKKEMGLTKARRAFSDREKKEIIQKFDLIREKLKEIGKFPREKRAKIECQIGQQLGTCRNKINKWKREFGKSRKTNKKGKCNSYYKQKKREFFERLDEFKGMLGEKIAEELGISERTLRYWKKEYLRGKRWSRNFQT